MVKTIYNPALIIVDMQKGSFTPETPRVDTDKIVQRINKLSHLFRDQHWPVIFIQHDGTASNEFLPHSSEWEILDEILVDENDICVNKYANDAFYNSHLSAILNRLKVTNLVIMGCATDFCVESTIQSALAKDYHLTIVSDGHTTGERPHMSGEKVIAHYNWVWDNMIPTKGCIDMASTEDIISTAQYS